MTTLVVDGDEVVANTVTKITSDNSSEYELRFPEVGGDAGEIAAGTIIPVVNTGSADLVVKTNYGHMVGRVKAKTEGYVAARNDGTYALLVEGRAFEPAAVISVPAAISGGESPTEAEFNALRSAVASINTALQNAEITAAS